MKNNVRDYVDKDNQVTKDLELQADTQQQKRKTKEEEIKNIDSHIQNLRSEYQKHLDSLENLQDHQEFLQKISDFEFIKHNKALANNKTEELKKKWIQEHRNNDWEDHIIFAEEIQAQQSSNGSLSL
jgi:hypothetical protein